MFVKAGALAAVFSNSKSIGTQAAQLAVKILEPSSSGSLGIVNPDCITLAINTDTAEKFGLKPEVVQEKLKNNYLSINYYVKEIK